MTSDRLFRHLEALQDDVPWGEVLDAGTGRHSFSWLASLPTTSRVGVTRDEPVRNELLEAFPPRGPQDEILLGDWSDPALLLGRQFDVVIADYLLGAIDSYTPYYQDRLVERLRLHTRDRLYVIGLEPWPFHTDGVGEQLILDVVRFRDAAMTLGGLRPYRELPMTWVVRQLDRAGFAIHDARSFAIVHSLRSIERQIANGTRQLPKLHDRGVADELERYAEALRSRAAAVIEKVGSIRFGADYVISARRA